MSNGNEKVEKKSFKQFYLEHYMPEHKHRLNQYLHVLGTILGIVYLLLCMLYLPWYGVVLFPLIHAIPGLIGHRLFERNVTVGDMRVLRKDFPGLWFILANHVFTYQFIVGDVKR